ncbi:MULTISPECIES: phage holin [unclassified Lactococcus]|uniref:phage holin n=1 Tax=unclassified Lactococcus TaxID=2643510 RepID=UPI0011C7B21B|nr:MULTISPECIES: phage holin [unclassified Lactococcus]MQW22936.1 holin [Lactococcus sp. dk101]TXK44517.1 holin [Lactococcus sp. dk310]TXK50370.1 holin [Lactococcus sp. dk322]
MILNDKVYTKIKWAVLTVLPALSVLVSVLGKAYGWGGTDLAVLTLNAVAVFLGAVTGVSAVNYKKENTDELE